MQHRKKNGYSIAEILLVFGIIAGVLIGVWAMYTMLGDHTDTKAAIAEIQLLRDAAVRHKSALGNGNNYATKAGLGGFLPNAVLKPYLGESGMAAGTNVFGDTVDLYIWPYPAGDNLLVEYYGIPNGDICVNVLNHFGKVTDNEDGTYGINSGDSITGYVGGEWYDMGCAPLSDNAYVLYVQID